jgi:hypothetical protein
MKVFNDGSSTISFIFNQQRYQIPPNGDIYFPDALYASLVSQVDPSVSQLRFEFEDQEVVNDLISEYLQENPEAINDAVEEFLQENPPETDVDFQPTKLIFVDKNRTDDYVASGSIAKPFKTLQAAIDYASAQPDVGTQPYNFMLYSGTYAEQVNLNDKGFFSVTIKGLGRVAINPASGNALTSNADNGPLQDLVVESIEFGRPVVLTGSGVANQFKTTEFRNCSFSSIATITLNRLNNFALTDVYCEAAFSATNVNFMFIRNGQIQSTFTYVLDSTLPQPANGVSGGVNILSMMMNAIALTVGGSAVMNIGLHNTRIGTTAGNFTIPLGCSFIAYNSILRGNWTNNGTLALRNSHSENDISGTAPTITANKGNQVAYVPSDLTDWDSAPTSTSDALNRIASLLKTLNGDNPIP